MPSPDAALPARAPRFAPLSLRAKAVLAFAAIALYFLGAGVVVSVQRTRTIATVEQLESLNRVESTLSRVNTFASQAALRIHAGDPAEDPRRIVESVELDVESIAAGLGALTGWFPEAGPMVQDLRGALHAARATGGREGLVELRRELGTLATRLDALSREVRARHDRMWARYRESYDAVTLAAALLFAAGLAVFGGIVMVFFRRLAWDVRAVKDRAVEVVHGFRGEALPVTRSDEVGALMESVNRMQQILRERESDIEVARQQRFHHEKMVAIGSLAAAVAHEINNPIAAIEGVAESIGEAKAIGCPLGGGDCQPEMILEHTRRIAGITRQLSQLASPHSTEPEWVDVNGIARATTAFVSYDPRFRAVHAELALDPAIPAAWAVADHVTQVLMNLLINAADALAERPPGRRTITVSTAPGEGGCIELCVRDDGPGMAPEVLRRAFDEGFTTKGPQGSGIGLFMCKTLVERGGGRVRLASRPGEGTAVTVSLPCRPPEGVPPQ